MTVGAAALSCGNELSAESADCGSCSICSCRSSFRRRKLWRNVMQLQINWRIPTLWLLDVWIAWH
jgi:hypothetical protein